MKKIGLLFVILIGLVAFVYFYEIEGEKKRQEAKEREESLFQMKQEEVTSIEIQASRTGPGAAGEGGRQMGHRQADEDSGRQGQRRISGRELWTPPESSEPSKK